MPKLPHEATYVYLWSWDRGAKFEFDGPAIESTLTAEQVAGFREQSRTWEVLVDLPSFFMRRSGILAQVFVHEDLLA